MFLEKENKKSIEKFANKIYRNFEKKDYKKVADIINNPFLCYLSFETAMSSRFSRSFTSSFGTCLQHAVVDIAKNQGFTIINDGNNDDDIELKGFYSDETRLVIDNAMEYINGCSSKNPISEIEIKKYFAKIRDKVLTTTGIERTVHADLVVFKDGLITCIEIKAGGDLDKGKAKNQRKEIFEIYAILVSKYKKEILNKEIDIEMKFGTFYNKDSMNEGVESWTQASVKKNFLNSELLIGKDFWSFLCNDHNAYSKILKIYNDHRDKTKKCLEIFQEKSIKEILKKANKIKNEEFKNSIKLSLQEEFLFDKLQLNNFIKINSKIIITNNEVSFIDKENNLKSLKIISDYNYEDIIIDLKNNNNLKEISDNFFQIII